MQCEYTELEAFSCTSDEVFQKKSRIGMNWTPTTIKINKTLSKETDKGTNEAKVNPCVSGLWLG